ncbi:caudovirus prohead protease, partial [Neisseria gonorrhoeae]
MTKLYAQIAKTEAQDDGTVKVWGYASSEAVDSDGEVVA